MGNKPSKAIYELIEHQFNEHKTIANSQNLQCLSDPQMIDHLLKIISEKVKDTEIDGIEKDMKLNAPREDTKEETESKLKKTKESLLQSTLVAGHELLPEIKAIFEGASIEEVLAPTTDSVRKFSHRMIVQLMSLILLMISKTGGSKGAASFCTRVVEYLIGGDKNSRTIKSTGAASALYFAALLIDPKKLLTDETISANLLEMFQTMESLSFYGWNKGDVNIDHSIEYIKTSLVKQLEQAISTTPVSSIVNLENIIKTICCIGLARGSVEDLLIAIELIIKTKTKFDMNTLLEKILVLPKVTEYLDSFSINLTKDHLEYEIPFEQIYIDKANWITEHELGFSSATDGEYVYFYSSVHGLVSLGIGSGLQKGKICSMGNMLECKSKIQLFSLKGKIYCFTEGKLNRLLTDVVKLKPSKKGECLPADANLLITSSGSQIITYARVTKEEPTAEGEESEKIQGDLVYFDVKTKKSVNTIQVTHTITDLQQIIVCGDLVIFAGKKKYEVINLVTKTTIKCEESALLKQATLCINPETYDIFAVFFVGDNEGVSLGKFEHLSIKQEKVPIINERVEQIKQLINLEAKDINAVKGREIYNILGMKPENVAQKSIDPIPADRVELLLAALAFRAKEGESSVKAAKLDGENIMKIYKTPLGVHLTARSFEAQMKLAETFFCEVTEAKVEETLALAVEKLAYILIILNQHLLSLRKCNISLSECTGKTGCLMFEKICHTILIPIAKDNLLAKYTVKNVGLTSSLKKSCDECIKNSQSLASIEIDASLQALIKAMEKFLTEKVVDENFHGLVAWLNTPDNIELVAKKLFEKNADCLKLLDMYFAVEEMYFNAKAKSFLQGDPKLIAGLSPVLRELSIPFSSTIDRLFIIIG